MCPYLLCLCFFKLPHTYTSFLQILLDTPLMLGSLIHYHLPGVLYSILHYLVLTVQPEFGQYIATGHSTLPLFHSHYIDHPLTSSISPAKLPGQQNQFLFPLIPQFLLCNIFTLLFFLENFQLSFLNVPIQPC